jgi:hypothetical protein
MDKCVFAIIPSKLPEISGYPASGVCTEAPISPTKRGKSHRAAHQNGSSLIPENGICQAARPEQFRGIGCNATEEVAPPLSLFEKENKWLQY